MVVSVCYYGAARRSLKWRNLSSGKAVW